MNAIQKAAYAALMSILVITACSKKESVNPPAVDKPAITALSVIKGAANTTVIITGKNFSATPSDDHVYFNGVEASVLSASANQLTVTVPAKAGNGTVTVQVNGSTAVGPTFTYLVSTLVSTFAGGIGAIYGDGTGAGAGFDHPYGITIDGSGNLYVVDEGPYVIRKITPLAVVTTIAGVPYKKGGKDTIASLATFFGPQGISADASGNLYVADFGNSLIRKVSNGVVTTFAGSDYSSGASHFLLPTDITLGKSGTFYVVDRGHNIISKVNSSGVITTFAGNGTSGIADGKGTAAGFGGAWGITVDNNENVYVTDGFAIRKITPDGTVSTLAGSSTQGNKDGTGSQARFGGLFGIAFSPDGNLYVADGDNNLIRKVTLSGVVTTYAGNGVSGHSDGVAANASFKRPYGITFDAAGAMYVTDSGNSLIRKVLTE